MDFLRIDPRMDEHPDIEAAGFDGARVFEAVLRACARNDGRGRLRGKFAHPGWLARRMNLTSDVIGGMDPDTWVNHGLERCVGCGLLAREGEDVIIPGWEKFYTPAKTNAERQADFRLKEKPDPVTKSNGRNETPLRVTESNGPSITPHHSTTLHSEEERESDAPPSADADPPHSATELQGLWNKHAHPDLPRWQEMPEVRKKSARKALKDRSLFSWLSVIQRISGSSFCRGQNDRGWVASPDWLIKAGVAAKVLEGKYDDRATGPPKDVRKGVVRAEDMDHSTNVEDAYGNIQL